MSVKKRPTIFDLEKATGFSRGTISRAFNERAEVSATTRATILKKAAEMGYAPHPGARSMTMGKAGRWGMLIPHLQNPYYSELMEALDREARQRGTVLLVGLSHYDAKVESDLVKHWASGETDGMVISTDVSKLDQEFLRQLREREFPLVFLYDRPSEEFDMVSSDTDDCLDRAMRHLGDFGHRRIAYLGQQSLHKHATAPFRAYERYFRRNGFEMDPALQHFGSYDHKASLEAWRKWSKDADPPTAVLCFNDVMASWFIHAARADGALVPQEISVIGNDDTSEALRTGVTTIRTDPAHIAQECFEMLYDPQPAGVPGRLRLVKGDFIMRDTVAKPRTHPLKVV